MDEFLQNIEAGLKGLSEGHVGWRVHYYDELTSTNDIALELIDAGAKEGEIIVADRQSFGRGRAGRSWESPKGLNIYMSVILKPALAKQNVARITIMTGVAVAKALASFSIFKPQIKWPNDVWIDGKKIAGVLCEVAAHGKCVIGIGVNVNAMASDFSEEVSDIATSLKIVNREVVDRVKVLRHLCEELDRWYRCFVEEGFDKVRIAHDEMSAIVGKRISVDFNGTVTSGLAKGVGDDGSLILLDDDGGERHVVAGDVVF